MPFRNQGRSRRHDITLAATLAAVAGSVNAAGFFVFGTHASHMTGQVAAIGEAIASRDPWVAGFAVRILAAFLLGAATCAALLDLSRGFKRGRHAAALLTEAGAILGVTWWALRYPAASARWPVYALAFAMGVQNAMLTRISGAIIRTTHLTGVVTDLGIEVVHVFRWFRERSSRGVMRGAYEGLRDIGRAPEFRQAWLHLALVVAFLAGATLGPVLLLASDASALGLPAIALLGLVILDLRAADAPPAAGQASGGAPTAVAATSGAPGAAAPAAGGGG